MVVALIFSTLHIEAKSHNSKHDLPAYHLWECPGHPTPNEIKEDEDRKERERDPKREILDEEGKEQYDKNEDAVIG